MAPLSRFASSLKPNVAYLDLNLSRALEEADHLAVLGIRGHPVPGSRGKGRRAGLDDRVEPLGHDAIRLRHLGDLREHVLFPGRFVSVRACFRLQLLGALLHRSSFLGRESLGLPVGSGGSLPSGFLLSHDDQSAGWKISIGLPDGSSRRICRPPGPLTMSLRKLTPAVRRRSTSASMSPTTK